MLGDRPGPTPRPPLTATTERRPVPEQPGPPPPKYHIAHRADPIDGTFVLGRLSSWNRPHLLPLMAPPPDASGPRSPIHSSSPRPPIVGIGVPADGVDALQAFFDGLPSPPNMALVVTLHRPAEPERSLVSSLQEATDLPVRTAEAGHTPQANTVSVLPPEPRIYLVDGQFRPYEPGDEAEPPSVIDTFFRSLAEDQSERAVGVLLAGTGTDGALGLRALKEQGAFTMKQAHEDAPHKDQLQSILNTGLVDVIDTAAQLGAELPRYWRHAAGLNPAGNGPVAEDEEEILPSIFTRLHAATGYDFSSYKRSTVRRRLRRRMALHRTPTLEAYLEILQNEDEIQALFRELLISVTSFFRDPNAYATLEETVIPELFANKEPEDELRVWSAGCATGEEAYSLAMLLDEYASTLDQPPEIQIFATDIHPHAVHRAREGWYPASIVADLSPERRSRHLRADGNYYRVKQRKRKNIIVAEHDLLQDPPFSELDLVSCRNVLIYLQRSLQEQVLRRLHYSLRPEGVLFLGRSESVSTTPDLFEPLSNQPLFQRSATAKNIPRASRTPSKTSSFSDSSPPRSPETLTALHQKVLLDETASVLVDRHCTILHCTDAVADTLSEETDAPSNLLEGKPEAVRVELQTALQRAFKEGKATGPAIIAPPSDDASSSLLLRVRPLGPLKDGTPVAQVVLEPVTQVPSRKENGETRTTESTKQLAAELQRTKAQLQDTIEEYETTTEELETSNEELLSMNDELQSKNAEIETRKEDLRSVNEQLRATNQELEAKVTELKETNDDLRNLMQATNVATLFLDRDLCLEWFTPQAQQVLPLDATDTGQPLSNVTQPLQYDNLRDDARTVFDTLNPIEREIRHDDGRWLLARMRPYRTIDDVVEGVVITFVDVTDRKQTALQVREERNFVEQLLDTVGALIVVLDTDFRIVRFNDQCETVTGYTEAKVKGESIFERLVPPEEAEDVRSMLTSLRTDADTPSHEHHWLTRTGDRRLIRWSNTRLDHENNSKYLIGTGVDITRRRQLEREVIAISDRERQRIGQDLHDLLASHLSGTAMMAQGVIQKLENGQPVRAGEVREISGLIKDASEQVRKLSHTLMPLDIHGDDLLEGLENLTRRRADMSGVTCTFEVHGPIPDFDTEVTTHLYRIAGEAVTNAIKHGNADRIDIRLRVESPHLFIEVRDDGVGISPEALNDSTLGLNMMRYHAALIGGHFVIEAPDEGGTVVRCSLPLPQLPQTPDSGAPTTSP